MKTLNNENSLNNLKEAKWKETREHKREKSNRKFKIRWCLETQ